MNRRDFLNLNIGDIVISKGRKAKILAIDWYYGLVKIQYLNSKKCVFKNYRRLILPREV